MKEEKKESVADKLNKHNKYDNFRDDPNYEPRVKVTTYEHIRKDGSKVVRTKSKMSRPTNSVIFKATRDHEARKKDQYSFRENVRFNQAPRFGRRVRNGIVKWVQVRPLFRRVLTKSAMEIIKEGFKNRLFSFIVKEWKDSMGNLRKGGRGRILPEFLKTQIVHVPDKREIPNHPGLKAGFQHSGKKDKTWIPYPENSEPLYSANNK